MPVIVEFFNFIYSKQIYAVLNSSNFKSVILVQTNYLFLFCLTFASERVSGQVCLVCVSWTLLLYDAN